MVLPFAPQKGEQMEKELFRSVVKYKGERAFDASSTRHTEMDKDFTEFAKKYIVASDATTVIYDLKSIEEDFGLEPGSIKAMLWDIGKALWKAEPQPNSQGVAILMLLYGLWAGDLRFSHIESKPMAF
jgi:hypothetical protein